MPASLNACSDRSVSRPRRGGAWFATTGALFLTVLVLAGCSETRVVKHDVVLPGKTFTGPTFLHGTVGSLGQVRGYTPTLVSGYGLVVNLAGTGSPDVPTYLRRWLINDMRKKGMGSSGFGAEALSPKRVLASPNTAAVLVQGLIPAGATRGTRFDLLVKALPQTQTTSLEGGTLWTADLSRGGVDTTMRFGKTLAQGRGATYLHPTRDVDSASDQTAPLRREAVVLSGGVAMEEMPLELILNRPSWQRSRLVADRINERFPRGPEDRFDTAVAKTDTLTRLHVPRRFAAQPDRLLSLIGHLYTQRGADFEPLQAEKLFGVLERQPEYGPRIAHALEALGKTTLPVIRRYYQHPSTEVRLTALEAGARLGDEAVTNPLLSLAKGPEVATRQRVASMLGYLPNSIRGARILHTLLDDSETEVRVAAYDALAKVGDPIIQRHVVGQPGQAKFALDLVPAERPLIYVAQDRMPRIVIFSPSLTVRTPMVARFWDNRLMLRSSEDERGVEVFYQPAGEVEAKTVRVEAGAAALAAMLAHKPTIQAPDEGLDLSYSQVVQVLYDLCRQGHIQAETHLRASPLAEVIARSESEETGDPGRPETRGDTPAVTQVPENVWD